MYSVETEVAALVEVAALPPEALPAYAELMSLLEVAPWSGDPYNMQRPDANMRTHTFGGGRAGSRSTSSWRPTGESLSCECYGPADDDPRPRTTAP